MITVIPANVSVPWKGIENGGLANDDGHGWAVARGDTLLVGKSMDLQEATDGFNDALLNLGQGAVSLFHSRFATHGTTNLFNVHPFYVKDERTVMAHNGVLDRRYQPTIDDARSDTHLYADRIGHYVDNPRGVPSQRIAKRIGADIGGYNKLVFLSVRSGAPTTRLVNASSGVFTDGVWFSNYGYEHAPLRTRTFMGWNEKDWWLKQDETECQLCKGQVDYDICMDCHSCQECLLDEMACDCYTPADRTVTADDRAFAAWKDAQREADEKRQAELRAWRASLSDQARAELDAADQRRAEQDLLWAEHMEDMKSQALQLYRDRSPLVIEQ